MQVLYKFLNQLFTKPFPAESFIMCCHSCEVMWADEDQCFFCGKAGILMAAPTKSSTGIEIASSGRSKLFTGNHIIVDLELLETVNMFDNKTTQHES